MPNVSAAGYYQGLRQIHYCILKPSEVSQVQAGVDAFVSGYS
jgi:hypothetical protein